MKATSKKVILVTVLLGLTIGVQAQHRMGRGHGMMQQNGGMMNQGGCMMNQSGGYMGNMNLSAEQQSKINGLQQQFWQQNQQRWQNNNAWQAHHNRVQALINANQFDQKAAEKLANERQSWRSEQMVKRWHLQQQIFQVLTPEQQQQWQQGHNAGSCGMY